MFTLFTWKNQIFIAAVGKFDLKQSVVSRDKPGGKVGEFKHLSECF